MGTPASLDMLPWVRKQVEAADGDLLREMVRTFAEAVLGAEVTALGNAG